MKKSDFLNEACKTTATNVRCLTTDITLLINACDEAAQWRRDHNMPYVETYENMSDRLRLLSEDLDARIDRKCDALLQIAKTKK